MGSLTGQPFATPRREAAEAPGRGGGGNKVYSGLRRVGRSKLTIRRGICLKPRDYGRDFGAQNAQRGLLREHLKGRRAWG